MKSNKTLMVTLASCVLSFAANSAIGEKTHASVAQCGHEVNDSYELRSQAKHRVFWRDSSAQSPQHWKRFKILGFNDFHGQLESKTLVDRPVGGAAVFESYMEAEAEQSDNGAILVHAGDYVGASPPISSLLQDEPSISFLNMMANKHCRYYFRHHPKCNIVGTLGNHEFDEGIDELLRLVYGGNHEDGPFLEERYRGARFPYVNANVVYEDTDRTVLRPYTIKWIKGIPVAFIGAVLKETPSIVTPSGVAGLSFLDEAESINRQVRKLKRRGVKAIVVTIHQGTRQDSYEGPTHDDPSPLEGAIGDIILNLHDEVDIVVSGHAHGFTNQLMENKNGKEILVTQAFSASTAYADIEVALDPKTRDIAEKSAQINTTWADEGPGLEPNAAVADMVALAAEIVEPRVNRVIGQAGVDITRTESEAGESAMGNLIADAQRAAMNTQVAFMNSGGIRADLDEGDATWGELFTIQPFGNDLISMELTGQQIIDVLNQQWSGANAEGVRILKPSGIEYQWDPTLPAEICVVIGSVNINGSPLDLSAVYSVTVNSFIANGGDNFTVLKEGLNRVIGPLDLDALVEYLELQPQPFSAQIEGRIIVSN
jgi:5'-nucleotidase